MESKIPKRPNPVLRTIVPSNRIKNAESHRDVTNSQLPKVRKRATSPESKPGSLQVNRFKMRRSRSACEIAFRRCESEMPPKLPRLNEASTSFNLRPTRILSSSGTNHRTAAKTGTTARVAPAKTAISKKLPTTTTGPKSGAAVSTTGATKPINKRIPPYDFKARYNDLLEKFKSLKEKYEQKSDALNNLENLSEQMEECQAELKRTQDELESTTLENETLRVRIQNSEAKLESVSLNLAKVNKELDGLKKEHQIVSAEIAELTSKTSTLEASNIELTERNEHVEKEIKLCRDQYFQLNIERKDIHNALMDLRGNIRVFCRVRPCLPDEHEKLLCDWNYIDEVTVEVVNKALLSKNKPGAHTFNFDYVFHPGCRQEDIFEMVSPLVQSAMDGYNICIFAYGQTGSGKTYTMDGTDSNAGVIPRTIDLIFQSVEKYKHLGWRYTIKATFLEIYNEVLYDLLSNEQKEMEIRMVKNNKNEIYVSNITEEKVDSADQLRDLLQIAKMNRATAATVGNERSSRSHAVTRIELTGYHEEKCEISIGTVNLVDLAGSESPKTSIRMNETKNINRSLSELTNVILALLQKQDHIPYRNSKLTHLLMPALGGNSKTLMFINVAPLLDCYAETVKSLRFAASVNSCKVSKAKRNRILNVSSSSQSLDK